jgi:hypothetical protein
MSLFIIGGTNVMLCYWWHKFHILTVGGINVAVGEISWWDKCQVGQMSVGQMSVGQMLEGQKLRHHITGIVVQLRHRCSGDFGLWGKFSTSMV